MIYKITSSVSNDITFKKLDHIVFGTKKGIKESFDRMGKDLIATSRRLILEESKSGRLYIYNINGKRISHIASAPGQSPANITGKLVSTINTSITGSYQMQFGAGNHIDVKYAKYLEIGTSKMEKRPYLIRAINLNERNNYVTLNEKIKRELNK